MRLDDGKGLLINTDNSVKSIEDQLIEMGNEFDSMMVAYRKMPRSLERQTMRVKMDSLEARYKALYKKWAKAARKVTS